MPFDKALAEKYTEALTKELHLKAGHRLKTIYIGGGTPTVLSAKSLTEIFKTLKECFELHPDIEITIEANPGTLSAEKTEALRSAGANRLSIGVQSFNDKELAALGRTHTSEEAVKAVETAKNSGFENISLDLIYGIPHGTLKRWQASLLTALDLSPKHISAYELTPEKSTPLYQAIKSNLLALPSEDEIVEMFNLAIDTLTSRGYRHYEISNYALSGCECRHNLNYWQRGEYIGAGAGAHSFANGKRQKNTEDILKYIELSSNGILPVEESQKVSPEDATKEFIFLGLRTAAGINTRQAGDLKERLAEASKELISEGLMELEGDYLKLTRKGILVSNQVIVRLFKALSL